MMGVNGWGGNTFVALDVGNTLHGEIFIYCRHTPWSFKLYT